ncbi:AAA family ATPase [Sulfurospirillum sp. hDNRA2]|uniref:AAA family ATPase n=1 Tax=Sulfurospirillum sp. hDNRA2 TaxID=3237298 RepID=UPI0020B73904|nr:AAA family ATPase [Sulfurospirillum sp. DNRA8]MCP3650773.1 AAA family ATPase [Sulfurospirillum sp. DNRA8]MCR1809618.1 AAA family ATPase [Sulfurospirillum sp. DNRA8]
MELVYLWVEEYKNIKNQGFNFSPRFTCKYDKDKNELTIEEKKDYVSIFPDNINVTAIVGENGSGKSSLCEEILNIVSTKILVIRLNNTFYVHKKDDVTINVKYEKRNLKLFHIVYLHTDILKYDLIKNWTEYANLGTKGSNPFYTMLKDKSQSLLHLDKFRNKFYLLIFQYFGKFQQAPFVFQPKKVVLLFSSNNDSAHIKNKLIEFEQQEKLKDFDIEKYIEFLKKIEPLLGEHNDITNLYNAILNQSEIFFSLIKIGILEINFFDDKERDFFQLSQGERKAFIDSLILYNEISASKKNDMLILVDEPDLSLHPEWQRRYLFNLLTLVETFKSKKFHFIISSHSPFILSDIPKENVIFLEKGKQAYPNIETFGANIHTLLSHSFFMKDGLMGEFAKSKINEVIDYLNGKKSPITDDDEAQRYIRIIGEPIVKRQLQRMLDSKKLDKMKEIDALKNQIESLQNRLDNLEKKP